MLKDKRAAKKTKAHEPRAKRPVRGMRRERMRAAEIFEDEAFIPDPTRGGGHYDEEADALGAEFLTQATSAEDVGELVRDELVEEELGGPFLTLEPVDARLWLVQDEPEELEDEEALREAV